MKRGRSRGASLLVVTTAPVVETAETAGSGDRRDDTSATNEKPTDSATVV